MEMSATWIMSIRWLPDILYFLGNSPKAAEELCGCKKDEDGIEEQCSEYIKMTTNEIINGKVIKQENLGCSFS